MDKPLNILKESCLYYGASLQGRQCAASAVLGTNRMLPAAINPRSGIYMFPTSSGKSQQCIWLSYYLIDSFKTSGQYVHICFYDGSMLEVQASRRIIDNQYKKTSQVIANLNRPLLFQSVF